MPYTPKLPGPKPTKAKRNARKPACPLESGDTKLLDICAEAGDIAVGLKPAIGLSHPPSSKSFILSDATTIYVAGNDEVVCPEAAAGLEQNTDQNEAEDEVTAMSKSMHAVDTEEIQTTADYSEALATASTSGNGRILMEERASTEVRSLTPIDISCQYTPYQSIGNGNYRQDIEEQSSDTGTFTSMFGLDNLIADGVVLGLMPNDDGELTSSSELTIVDFDSRVEDAAESRDKQQQLQRWGDLTPCLKEAGRVESSGTTTSRDGGKEDDVVSAGGFGKESEASNNDKRDRYEVERIFDHDEHNGRKRYLVKWSGWSAEDMTWEPEGNLDDCQYIVEQYWKSVENLDTTGNISGTSAHSLVRDDRSHLMHPLVKRSAPRLTTRKRKVSQDEQDFSTADEENKRTHTVSLAQQPIEDVKDPQVEVP
ncbi:hypothetical protein E8E11_001659 [Didymella keratinophila]|nr:hypothetical protein E8E11_001659 [Didymella keratinophila]